MTEMIARHKGWIEAVLCDNDEMALGAVAAFRIAGYMRTNANTIPILGIDATPVALEAVKEGLLLGTLRSDAEVKGRTLFKLALDMRRKGPSEWARRTGNTTIWRSKVTRQRFGLRAGSVAIASLRVGVA